MILHLTFLKFYDLKQIFLLVHFYMYKMMAKELQRLTKAYVLIYHTYTYNTYIYIHIYIYIIYT